MGPMLARDYPEIEAYVRFQHIGRVLFQHEDDAFYWDDVYLADKNVFDVFTHKIIYGDPKTALSDPHSMAISESFARRYFGDANPIGKTISSDTVLNKITLVFDDLPENTHLKYDVLISYPRSTSPGDEAQQNRMLFSVSDYTYLLMPKGYQAEFFQEIYRTFYARYMAPIAKEGYSVRAWLEPLADIHLKSDIQHDRPKGNILHIYAFSAVALFILLVACINYINLATARSMKRGREVGMRKVLGATRPQLIAQFLGESIFFTLIALVIGVILVKAAFIFTPINKLLDKHQLMNLNDEPVLLLWMLGLSIAVGLISGIYPAFHLSSVQPISNLTGTTHSGKRGFRVRQTLVLIQFIISIGIIASTILMGIQMEYVTNKPLGFKKENQMIIGLRGADLIEKVPVIRNELLKDHNILAVSTTLHLPGAFVSVNSFPVENNEGVMESQSVSRMQVGEDFIKVMGIKLSKGRDFSKKLLSDEGGSVLVNETRVKRMGWVEPIGKRTAWGRVIGVVKDFNFYSLHRQFEPLVMHTTQDDFSKMPPAARMGQFRNFIVNISGEEMSKTLKYIQDVFEEFDPKNPFEYAFLGDFFDSLYVSEHQLMKLTGIFSGICILISCLGLFGLAAFTTEQRTKEIGVRKVLGASTFQIIVMLSRNILIIVLGASIIASVIAWYAISEWLNGFAFHVGINPLVFVISAVIALAVAFGTVALQSFKAAQENPVKALRYE
jgi:putative ABC transport system permease protein